MIEVKNISYAFGEKQVLNNLSMSFESGHVHGLVGLNGAGKTTLLNILYGFLKPSSGEVLFKGLRTSKNLISMLDTSNFFYSNITGREYLKLFPDDNSSFNLDVWQDLFQLPLDNLIENYSTGMKKKLALLGILKHNKSILILDEPFNGLDLEANKIVELLIEKLKTKEKTIIITSHIIETLTSTCDRIHFLVNGRIQKSYQQENFGELHSDIFKDFEAETRKILNTAI